MNDTFPSNNTSAQSLMVDILASDKMADFHFLKSLAICLAKHDAEMFVNLATCASLPKRDAPNIATWPINPEAEWADDVADLIGTDPDPSARPTIIDVIQNRTGLHVAQAVSIYDTLLWVAFGRGEQPVPMPDEALSAYWQLLDAVGDKIDPQYKRKMVGYCS